MVNLADICFKIRNIVVVAVASIIKCYHPCSVLTPQLFLRMIVIVASFCQFSSK